MKNFLYSFLGTIAGLWASLFIGGFLLIVSIVLMVVVGASEKEVSIRDHSILYLDLKGEITEQEQTRSFFDDLQDDDAGYIALNKLTGAIRCAAGDKKIDGIFIDCNGLDAGPAQLQAIFSALKQFKKDAPEKWIYAYGDYISQGDYFTACAADSIFINPLGILDFHGLSATGMYFKQLLDRLGVNVQVVKVGTYKSAVEPFIMTEPSEASVEQQKLFLDNMWKEICKLIAAERKVKPEAVNSWANSLVMAQNADTYLSMKMVDRTLYRHQMLERLQKLTDRDSRSALRFVTPDKYAQAADITSFGKKSSAKIGVYYASGDIYDTGSDGISAEEMVEDLLDLADDDDLDALVLRVNSPGGSAFASEQIWEAVGEYKRITGKPVYVSMSDYAASGGYYISCGADKIYAEPLTLTGSIGIFGMIPDASRLITDKVGINIHTVSTNPDGELPSLFMPMTPQQKLQMQSYVNRGYELFVRRVAEGRHMSVDSVKMIAEGRVWDGVKAKEIGLVDCIGGLDKTLADLAAGLNVESYEIVEYPEVEQKWWKQIMNMRSDFERSVEARMIRSRLGDATQLFDAMQVLGKINPLQTRMSHISVKL